MTPYRLRFGTGELARSYHCYRHSESQKGLGMLERRLYDHPRVVGMMQPDTRHAPTAGKVGKTAASRTQAQI